MRLGGLATVAFLVIGAGAGPVHAASQTLPLSDFVAINLANGIKATIVPAAAISVTAQSSRPGDISDLRTSVEDGVLHAWYDWSIWHVLDFAGRDMTLQIAMPELDAVTLSGGSALNATSVPTDDLTVSATDGSRALINGAAAKRYTIAVAGGATVAVSGTCYSSAVNASGGATLAAKDLVCADVTGVVSGGARVDVTATASITADASGGGVMTVRGSPAVTKVNSTGGGRVDFAN